MPLVEEKTSTSLNSDLREVGVYTDATQKRKAVAVIGDVCLVDSSGNEIDMTDLEVDIQSISSGNVYVGKPSTATGADFTTAYGGTATTITLSNFPAPYTGFVDEDIEVVRQINNTGTVVATYTRDDVAMSIAGGVTLTVTGATFAATDTFIVGTNIPRISSALPSVGGGKGIYSNAQGDFVATITNGTTNITITGLPFTLEATHVLPGFIIKDAVTTHLKTVLSPTSVSVSGGVITLGGVSNFATGDNVTVFLVGPDKAYDLSLDSDQVIVQNPQYGHYTNVETLISESNLLGYKATADAGGDTDTIIDADGAFSVALQAVGYIAYQTTDTQSATINSVASATTIETTTLSGAATWASKAYSLPQVKRYEIPMEGYNFLTIHYRLSPTTNCNCYLKIYGTLDATATADADTNWVDLSSAIFGAAAGISVAVGTITESIKVLDTPTTMLKYMLKLVQESNTASAATNTYTVFIKKSS